MCCDFAALNRQRARLGLAHDFDEKCMCDRCNEERDRRRELAGRKPKPQ